QVFAGLNVLAEIVAQRTFLCVGAVTEGPIQELQPVEFVQQKGVAATLGDQVVQSIVQRMGVGDQPVAVVRNRADEPAELGRQLVQLVLADPSAGGPDGLALQGASK